MRSDSSYLTIAARLKEGIEVMHHSTMKECVCRGGVSVRLHTISSPIILFTENMPLLMYGGKHH